MIVLTKESKNGSNHNSVQKAFTELFPLTFVLFQCAVMLTVSTICLDFKSHQRN